eukprot:13139-Heterococcus_DN1.PRE.1
MTCLLLLLFGCCTSAFADFERIISSFECLCNTHEHTALRRTRVKSAPSGATLHNRSNNNSNYEQSAAGRHSSKQRHPTFHV